MEGIDKFRGDSKLSSWLFRIAVNEVLGHLRKIKYRSNLLNEAGTEEGKVEGEILGRSEDASRENEMLFRIDLEKALKELSDDDADIILLLAVGYTAQEIADTRKISLTAAKTRIHRARLALKELMADHAGKK